MPRPISCDKERISFNLARLKKGGLTFEIVVEPNDAIAYKQGKNIDIKDILKSEKIFSDAYKGLLASETEMNSLFGSLDPITVAQKILKDGEIQLTVEFRDKLREKKKKKITYLIHKNAMDPQTKLPHPLIRIENAFEEAKIKIDEFKTAEEQVEDAVKKLRPIIPIKIEQSKLKLTVPPQFAHQSYGIIKKFGDIKQETWGSDGALVIKVEMPAGFQAEFMEKINNLTHGGADIELLE